MQYRKLRIDYVDDCGPNEGGYYCQVYRESDEKQINDFCIHPDELVGITDPEDFLSTWMLDASMPCTSWMAGSASAFRISAPPLTLP